MIVIPPLSLQQCRWQAHLTHLDSKFEKNPHVTLLLLVRASKPQKTNIFNIQVLDLVLITYGFNVRGRCDGCGGDTLLFQVPKPSTSIRILGNRPTSVRVCCLGKSTTMVDLHVPTLVTPTSYFHDSFSCHKVKPGHKQTGPIHHNHESSKWRNQKPQLIRSFVTSWFSQINEASQLWTHT